MHGTIVSLDSEAVSRRPREPPPGSPPRRRSSVAAKLQPAGPPRPSLRLANPIRHPAARWAERGRRSARLQAPESPTVHDQRLAGYVSGQVAGKEHRNRAHVVYWVADATQWRPRH